MEKKSKKGLIIGISVAAVVVIAALVTGLYFILRKTPEEIVKNAMKDTFAETREKGYSLQMRMTLRQPWAEALRSPARA